MTFQQPAHGSMSSVASNTSPADAREVVVQTEDLQMSYGSKEVLLGVDLQIHRGEVVCLLGPNGAGKTTTIEILEGFRARSAGDVQVLGQDPQSGTEDWRARLGVVLQSWRDHNRWKVRTLLHQLGGYYLPYATEARQRPRPADELIELVGLSEQAELKVSALSGGQRRRLDVAIGLVGAPELLFLDEPTAGFDPVARREFHDLIHRLSDLEDTTILLTTHDLAEAERLADRILILMGGRIAADGSAEALARQVAGQSEVRWSIDGTRHVHASADATGFVRQLFADHGNAVEELEVQRASLEETYMTMVQRHEAGQALSGAGEAAFAGGAGNRHLEVAG